MQIECKKCGATKVLKRDPSAPDRVLLEGLTGWSFTTDTGWLCKAHAPKTVDDTKAPNEVPTSSENR